MEDEPKEFLDPNKLSDDGTAAINSSKFSESGRCKKRKRKRIFIYKKKNIDFAYRLSKKGSDWSTIYVIDCETGETMKDLCEWVKIVYKNSKFLKITKFLGQIFFNLLASK